MGSKLLLEKHQGISRIDQESNRTHGWYARINYHRRTLCKFFSDRKHGGRHSSLLLALDWRDKTAVVIGKLLADGSIAPVPNVSTGVVGVRLNEKHNRYEVFWMMDGKRGSTSVSILKHGKKKAFEIACRIRQEKTI